MEHEQLGALANGEQMRSHLFLLSLDFGCLQGVDVFCFSSQGQGGETAYTILNISIYIQATARWQLENSAQHKGRSTWAIRMTILERVIALN